MTTLDMVGDGAMLTCVDDLVLWDRNFYDNQLGRGGQALIDLMTTPARLNNGETIDYGFGLDLAPYGGLPCVSHGGWFVGYRSEMMRFPTERFTVICLANSSAINPTSLSTRVADLWLGDVSSETALAGNSAERLPSIATEAEPTPINGLYFDEATERVMEIATQLGQPAADFGRGPKILVPLTPDHWRTEDEWSDLYFRDGRLEVTQYGRPYATFVPVDPAMPTVADLDRLAGAYTNDELDVTYALHLAGDALWLQYGRVGPALLKPVNANVMRHSDRTLHFEADENGTISGFTLGADRAWGFWFARQTVATSMTDIY